MEISASMNAVVNAAATAATRMHHEFLTPEHLLLGMLEQEYFVEALTVCGADGDSMKETVKEWLEKLDKVVYTGLSFPMPSMQFTEMMKYAMDVAGKKNKSFITPSDYAEAILMLQDSEAAYLLGTALEGLEGQFLAELEEAEDDVEMKIEFSNAQQSDAFGGSMAESGNGWKGYVTDISAEAVTHTPLIGRELELDRTIQILCRKEKNNPLHIGDPGVGKTAMIYGLATMINENNVPQRLQGRKIYGLNVADMLAGAQYRGDFEKRMKSVLEGARREKAILYLDEIHNMIGAGRNSDGGPDASNILKPYLESGELSFVGATTYDEYNKRMSKDKAITRRFQVVDIKEPTVEETVKILYGLQADYQKYHKVVYRKDVLEYAVNMSARYIPERRLPDKAIDLIDEAGAMLEVHPVSSRSSIYVTKKHIDQILKNVCKIQAESLTADNNENLLSLKSNMLSSIYGQNEAIDDVADAVMMAKAGLNDDEKPLASLLFVGPTGVGKTEVARVLAKQLGVELLRFDMSEYTEKHTVAKLIGSPAGYVGYEDGGLLTDAIRNTPNCVLLLDEIEKAHSDIYNILLQVMDYAKLTDNRGQKADFRNVILIMTSNAGAQYASQASIGFGKNVSRGEAMMKQVKKTFKPEFLNRLSDIVVFNDMDENMARMILKKKFSELSDKLKQKNITAEIDEQAMAYLLKKGFTKEYGAREIDRVLARELKPLFMKEILFGKLKKGGKARVEIAGDSVCLNINK